jgi:hypothetical protein
MADSQRQALCQSLILQKVECDADFETGGRSSHELLSARCIPNAVKRPRPQELGRTVNEEKVVGAQTGFGCRISTVLRNNSPP